MRRCFRHRDACLDTTCLVTNNSAFKPHEKRGPGWPPLVLPLRLAGNIAAIERVHARFPAASRTTGFAHSAAVVIAQRSGIETHGPRDADFALAQRRTSLAALWARQQRCDTMTPTTAARTIIPLYCMAFLLARVPGRRITATADCLDEPPFNY